MDDLKHENLYNIGSYRVDLKPFFIIVKNA